MLALRGPRIGDASTALEGDGDEDGEGAGEKL